MEIPLMTGGHESLSIFVHYVPNLLSAVGLASWFAALGKGRLTSLRPQNDKWLRREPF